MTGKDTRFGADAQCAAGALALLATAVFCLACGGCASSGPHPVATEFQPFTEAEQAAWDSASSAEYRMRQGDVFDVLFKFYPEMDQQKMTVLPDGRISLPHIDAIEAAGLTISQLDSAITASYGVDYRDPDLSIVIRSFGELVVYVLGEVHKPGSAVLTHGRGSILQAISDVGGFTSDASTSEVLHIRVTPEGYQYRRLDLSHLEKRTFMTPEITDLRSYDVIYVPRTAVGDLNYFRSSVLSSVLSVADLFWDIYAISNISKVDRLVR